MSDGIGSRPVKVRKRPVVVEAMRFTGHNHHAILTWAGVAGRLEHGEMVITTLEGDHVASHGDYILRGVAGEFYPVKPSIFEATYDLVGEGQ